ncbi:MAG: hypothetical protein KDE47_07490 [Caldilineaceae bacterium]|nr:hypothetical protein [Caldilineaceae bacterium]
MNTDDKLASTDRRALLSTLWIFVLLNIVFRDIHELFRPGLLAEMMASNVNGVQITDEVMLLGGVMLEIPIAMVLLSRLLAHRVNRWTNVIVGVVTVPILFTDGPKDLDDMWFLAIEVVALALIIWYAWRWRVIHSSAREV